MSSNGLKRVLGPTALVAYGVGIIVGAGIYSVIGAAAGAAEHGLWLSFLISGVAALLTALSYAELAAAIPRAGAEYVYLSRAFPTAQAFAFLTGFVTVAAGVLTTTTVAIAFGGYASGFVEIAPGLLAFGLLVGCTAVNIWGIREASWINIGLTILEVLGLIIVITLGVQAPEFGKNLAIGSVSGVMAGAALIFFVYIGFEDLANLAEESANPGRDMPIGLLVSLGISTLLYVLVAVAVVALVSPETLAGSDSPLATAVEGRGAGYRTSIAAIALVSTANTCLIAMIGVSRMLYGMAERGAFPPILGRLLPGRQTPYIAALVVFGGGALALLFRRLEVVAAVSSFAALLAFLAVNASVIMLRFREPDLERPFRVPWTWGRVPVPAVLGIVVCLALMVRFEAQIYVAGAVGLVIAGVVYLVHRKVTANGQT